MPKTKGKREKAPSRRASRREKKSNKKAAHDSPSTGTRIPHQEEMIDGSVAEVAAMPQPNEVAAMPQPNEVAVPPVWDNSDHAQSVGGMSGLGGLLSQIRGADSLENARGREAILVNSAEMFKCMVDDETDVDNGGTWDPVDAKAVLEALHRLSQAGSDMEVVLQFLQNKIRGTDPDEST